MALGLKTQSESGEFVSIIKYDARAGRMFRVDRTQSSTGDWQTDNVEITQGFTAVFDLANIQVGWALFESGSAPSLQWVSAGQPMPPKPTPNHKQAFRVLIKLGRASADPSKDGDVREFVSVAKIVISAIDRLHTEFEAGSKDHPGQLPVVELTSTKAVTTGSKAQSSTNYEPQFSIVKWVPRPADLGEVSAAPVKNEPAKQASPPPPAPPALAKAGFVGADDF